MTQERSTQPKLPTKWRPSLLFVLAVLALSAFFVGWALASESADLRPYYPFTIPVLAVLYPLSQPELRPMTKERWYWVVSVVFVVLCSLLNRSLPIWSRGSGIGAFATLFIVEGVSFLVLTTLLKVQRD